MKRIKLVLQPDQFSSFTSFYLESLWGQYFDIEIFDSSKKYEQSALFVVWWANTDDPVVTQLTAQGHKVVVDNLWEHHNTKFDKYYQLSNTNWFWYNESLWWSALGYDQYRPEKMLTHIALMPIRRASPVRDWIVDNLKSLKDQMIWSYRQQHLPDDSFENNDVSQRFMNPGWYNATHTALVIETKQHGQNFHSTDKTYKALAFYQPLLVIGQQNSLKCLQDQGFETFDNIFDESYDSEPVFEKRFNLVVNNLKSIKLEPYSDLTWEKLRHNHNHFFDTALCKQRIIEEIIQPLIHYAET
jgi:hypothetical protein